MYRAIVLLTLLAVAGAACAWGPTGHRVVGRIAENHLTPGARAGVAALIGPQSLAEVSTWADEIKSDPAWKHASSWHWVTIEDGEDYARSNKNRKGDVVESIVRFTATLRSKSASRAAKGEAIKWLVHLVADVHQPLHVGRGPDRGGNAVTAHWFNEPTNMHRVWDSHLIDQTQLSFSELAAFIDHANEGTVRQWQADDLSAWVAESMAHRERVYTVPESAWEYSYRNMPVVRERLLQAGVRLAGILNDAFKGRQRFPAN